MADKKKTNNVLPDSFINQVASAANGVDSIVEKPVTKEAVTTAGESVVATEPEPATQSKVEKAASPKNAAKKAEEDAQYEMFLSLVDKFAPDNAPLIKTLAAKQDQSVDVKFAKTILVRNEKLDMLRRLRDVSGVAANIILDNLLDFVLERCGNDLVVLEKKYLESKLHSM